MADGGQMPAPQSQVVEDPGETLGNAAIHGGLLGLLQNAGHSNLANFTDKHTQILSDPDSKLNTHIANQDYDKASSHIQGSPLAGQVSQTNLNPILQRLAPVMANQEPHAPGFRSAVNYLNSAIKGGDKLKGATGNLFSGKMNIKPDAKIRQNLKDHLNDLSLNPEKALDVGGDLNHYLPGHAVNLASMTGAATTYLQGLKPKSISVGPLENPPPASKSAEDSYNRQLDIAEQPLNILKHVKEGNLLPQDLTTIQTIYPSLFKSMVSKANEQLISDKTKGIKISYKQRLSLSMLLGQPMDSSLTQPSMQAVMAANAPKSPPVPPQGKKPTKPSNAQNQKLADSFKTETQKLTSDQD